MLDEYKIDLPLYVGGRPKKVGEGLTKKHWLNLNNYRNLHFQTLNGTKKEFKALVKDKIEALPVLWDKIEINYVCYLPNKTKRDIANMVGVIDKYFADALVELGKLEDDNYNIYQKSSWKFGGIDKENPRMEAWMYRFEDLLI